jgi:hypothetical protein
MANLQVEQALSTTAQSVKDEGGNTSQLSPRKFQRDAHALLAQPLNSSRIHRNVL